MRYRSVLVIVTLLVLIGLLSQHGCVGISLRGPKSEDASGASGGESEQAVPIVVVQVKWTWCVRR